MATTKQEFVEVAREIFEEFSDFLATATFKKETGIDRETGKGTGPEQQVEGIQVTSSEQRFQGLHLKVGDYLQLYEYRNFDWLPSVDDTYVTMNGVKCLIADQKIDAANAVVILSVKRV